MWGGPEAVGGQRAVGSQPRSLTGGLPKAWVGRQRTRRSGAPGPDRPEQVAPLPVTVTPGDPLHTSVPSSSSRARVPSRGRCGDRALVICSAAGAERRERSTGSAATG